VGQLVGRNIENAVKTRLQRSAKRHGRSMEEEVRDMCHGSFIWPDTTRDLPLATSKISVALLRSATSSPPACNGTASSGN
jgi:plasmid stability protein